MASRARCFTFVVLITLYAAAHAQLLADDAVLQIHGAVRTESGDPVSGAKLVLPIRGDWLPDAMHVEGISDDQGEFQLEVPPSDLPAWETAPRRALWCYAEGYCMEMVSTSSQLDQEGKDSGKPLEVVLTSATPMAFIIQDPTGEPLVGCQVRPLHWRVGSYDIPPKPIADLLTATTDKQGQATLDGVIPDRLLRIATESAPFGIQYFQLNLESPAAKHTCRLASTGTLAGKLVADGDVDLGDLPVAVESRSAYGPGTAEGYGDTRTESDGSFRFPKLAPGSYYLLVRRPPEVELLPDVPDEVLVEAGETNVYEIPLEPAIEVSGSVVARDSDRPVEGARVSVSYGPRQSNDVYTDAEGNYTAKVLPGEVRRQLIVIPKDFASWMRGPDERAAVRISRDSGPITLEPLEIIESQILEGKLLDRNGAPAADYRLHAKLDDGSYGYGQSSAEGIFQLRVAKGGEVQSYSVSSETGSSESAKKVSDQPLVLQLVDPNSLVNVEVTTAPTPPDTPLPAWNSHRDELSLIIAKEALVFQKRSTDWAEVAATLEQLATEQNASEVKYYFTIETYRDSTRTQEAKMWAEMLTESTGVRVDRGGRIVMNEPAVRYDGIKLGEQWPPAVEQPIVGRVVDADGGAVPGANVMLLLPPPASWRYGRAPLYLNDGQPRNLSEQVVTLTDGEGRFEFEFPSESTNLLIGSQAGFSITPATTDLADIELKPWARVTGTVPKQDEKHPITISADTHVRLPDGTSYSLHDSAISVSSPSTDFELARLPAGQSITIRRTLWNQVDGSWVGNTVGKPLTLTLEPGTTTHLEFGPVEAD